MKVEIQLQLPGGSFDKPSITLTWGGDTVLIPISKETQQDIMDTFPKIPTEG